MLVNLIETIFECNLRKHESSIIPLKMPQHFTVIQLCFCHNTKVEIIDRSQRNRLVYW